MSTARHGTAAGFTAHQVRGERPCDPCFFAKQEYDKRRREAPERVRRSRLHAAAQSRAYRRLAAMHPAIYAALYAEAKAAIADEVAAGAR